MSSTRTRLLLACCLCTAACGEPRLIGRACPPGGCDLIDPPPPGNCSVQLSTTPERVEPGKVLDRCELFTLDALPAIFDQGKVYVTRTQVRLTPLRQHLEVRLAPAIDDFDAGPVSCEELYERAVPWIPLLTTRDVDDVLDLSRAPLVAATSHWLLIIHNMVNSSDEAVDVSVVLNVECAEVRPAVVSQAFEFSDRKSLEVKPGEQDAGVSNKCVFNEEVLVSRLYRRTHLISGFRVWNLDDPGNRELVWSSGDDWTLDLDPPRPVASGDGFEWECTYANTGALPFVVDGDSPDACALLGFYQLPGGGEDDSPERCTR
jgi:hypothetical protein